LLPEDKDAAVPDAIGLHVFESRLVGDRTPRSVSGRAISLVGRIISP
jgi:hypothetical protein